MEEEKIQIKEAYKELEEIIKLNPQLYIMPKELYNSNMCILRSNKRSSSYSACMDKPLRRYTRICCSLS